MTSSRLSTPLAVSAVHIDDAFWSPRINTVRERTIPFQYQQLEIVGHLRALRREPAATDSAPHPFWDSDVAKWIEAASYSLIDTPDAGLDAQLDDVITLLAAAQQPDGYLNTYFTVVAPDRRWSDLRDAHELYCAGHLIEAGVAHFTATGKRTLLDIVQRYADYIGEVFGRDPGQIRGYDGHEEIELALVKLAEVTGKIRYLDLASFFVDERGHTPYFFDLEREQRGTPGFFDYQWLSAPDHPGSKREYRQDHLPVREQTEAVGHAVRAMYLYSAMADLARERGDDELLAACRRLWTHLTSTRMYVTGGIGSSSVNEGFTHDYDLPDETAYAETCAAIGLMMWAQRMLRVDRDRRYGDIMELALYNGVIDGISAEGTRFFYDNPLASRGGGERHEWFDVACCPPNLARLMTSLGSYAYAAAADELIAHLFVSGTVRFPLSSGAEAVVTLAGDYPWRGAMTFSVDESPVDPFTLTARIPAWADGFRIRVNGGSITADHDDARFENGYFSVTRTWSAGDTLTLDLPVEPRRLWADPRVVSAAGRAAVARGPFIYAAEEADNGTHLHTITLAADVVFREISSPSLPDVLALTAPARRRATSNDTLYSTSAPTASDTVVTLVPYYAWANRGAGEMRIWLGDE